MDKKRLKFIFFNGIPFIAGFLFTVFTAVESFENQSLVRGVFALTILLLSLIGYVYFFDKTEKIISYSMKSLCMFFFFSSLSFSANFLILLIRPDFKPEHIPPRRGSRLNYDWNNFNIFSYLTVLLVVLLVSVLVIGGIFIGLWIDNKINKKQKIGIMREEKDTHQYIKIKSIRIISTAQPLMINGKKIEKKDDSDLVNKIIYID